MEVVMTTKHVICPQRLRKVPKKFSWVDHRLVRDGYIKGVSHEALALYLFLVTVSDAEGLSYYSDGAIYEYLGMDANVLGRSRRELCSVEFIVYQRPLYQVLSIDKPFIPSVPAKLSDSRRGSEALSIKDIFAKIAGGEQ